MVKCYICEQADDKENLIKEEIIRYNEQKTYKYHHEQCLIIKNTKQTNPIYKNESKKHKNFKTKIFQAIINNQLILMDQNNIKYSFDDYDFIAIESPVTKQHQNKIPFNNLNQCKFCISKYKKNNNFDVTNKSEFYDKLNIKIYQKQNKDYYHLHPCINCPYNYLHYLHIFDIGIGKNGIYKYAIEIANTNKANEKKLTFCRENNIDLFEIDIKNIKYSKIISCKKL